MPSTKSVTHSHPLSHFLTVTNQHQLQVQQKTFVANITTQVVERHTIRGLEKIFSPVVVNGLSDAEVEAIASEPGAAKRRRLFLEDRVAKLGDGQGIFRGVMGSAAL